MKGESIRHHARSYRLLGETFMGNYCGLIGHTRRHHRTCTRSLISAHHHFAVFLRLLRYFCFCR